jgi:uncharacterized membrane protein YfcA
LAAGSVPGALGGVWALERLHAWYGKDFDKLTLFIVAGALAVTGVATLGRAMFMRGVAARERDTVDLQLKHKVAAVTMGLTIGFVLGISSAGSGALIAVGLILVFRLTPRRVVGTDVFHAAILLWVASFAHIISGNVDFGLAGNLLVGSLPGVWIGSSASIKVSPAVLRPTLGIVLCTASLGILIKADVGVPGPLFVVVPLALALLAWRLPIARERGAARRSVVTARAQLDLPSA